MVIDLQKKMYSQSSMRELGLEEENRDPSPSTLSLSLCYSYHFLDAYPPESLRILKWLLLAHFMYLK